MSYVYVPTPYEGEAKWTKNKDKRELENRFSLPILFYQFKINFFNLYDNRCFKCKKACTWVSDRRLWYEGALHQWELDIDHNFPFELGGRLEEGNMVSLCKNCNSKKNKKLPKEFYSDNELESLERYLITQADLFPKKKSWEIRYKFDGLRKDEIKKILIEEYGIDKELVEITGSVPKDGIHNYGWSTKEEEDN